MSLSKTRHAAAVAAAALSLAAAGTAHAQTAAGNVANGEKNAAMCIGCHGIPGYQSSFPQVHKVPMISGQNAKYIVAALTAYKKGERRHPSMRGIGGSLTDQQMADLGAFYEQHGRGSLKTVAQVPDAPAVAPSAQVAELLTKGACVSCHGANFNKPIDGSYPKIAGQFGDYLYVALRAYKVEGNPQVGRANAIMGAQVKQFSSAELKAMATYIASLPGDLRTVQQSRFR